MATKISQLGRAILKSKAVFPDFNLLDYDISLARNLAYYNSEIENSSQKKEWCLNYWKSLGKDISKLSKVSDMYYDTAGAVAHMIHLREIDLDVRDVCYLDKKYIELTSLPIKDAISEATLEEKSALKDMKAEIAFNVHLTEFECGIDMFFIDKEFNAKQYITRNSIKVGVAKQLADCIKPMMKELKEVASKKDAQLVEAYSFLSIRQMNKFIAYVQGLIDACESSGNDVKALKAKANKKRPPSEIVKSVKCLEYDDITKLKSKSPVVILESSEVWIYNVKTRRLFKCVPIIGNKLSILGTTIINLDLVKSGGKIIRKPESQLIGVSDMNRKLLNKTYDDIRCTESKSTGRLSEDTIIVSSF